jgi:hypothetical protein
MWQWKAKVETTAGRATAAIAPWRMNERRLAGVVGRTESDTGTSE